jgi:hypothetical protein
MIDLKRYDLARDSLSRIDGTLMANCDNERKIAAISKIIQEYKTGMGWT